MCVCVCVCVCVCARVCFVSLKKKKFFTIRLICTDVYTYCLFVLNIPIADFFFLLVYCKYGRQSIHPLFNTELLF